MSVTSLSWQALITCLGVVMCLLGAYNTFATARKNKRDEEERKKHPEMKMVEEIRQEIANHAEWLKNDKGRIEKLERAVDELRLDTQDIHAAQAALCYGVQSLLEHALHNGNDDEMISASRELNRYLRSRRTSHDES